LPSLPTSGLAEALPTTASTNTIATAIAERKRRAVALLTRARLAAPTSQFKERRRLIEVPVRKMV
jgi:hypothetical protein